MKFAWRTSVSLNVSFRLYTHSPLLHARVYPALCYRLYVSVQHLLIIKNIAITWMSNVDLEFVYPQRRACFLVGSSYPHQGREAVPVVDGRTRPVPQRARPASPSVTRRAHTGQVRRQAVALPSAAQRVRVLSGVPRHSRQ